MSRNFGIIGGRLTTGARHQPSASRANSTLRDLYIPASILPPADTPLPLPDFPQPMFNVFGAILFASVVGLWLAFVIGWVLFIEF